MRKTQELMNIQKLINIQDELFDESPELQALSNDYLYNTFCSKRFHSY